MAPAIQREPATRQFDWSFALIPKSDERFARQHRCGSLPKFPLASPRSSIVHHLSGLDKHAHTQTLLRRSRSVDDATRKGILSINFLARYEFTHPLTHTHVRLLGPCFKRRIGAHLRFQLPRLWSPPQSALVHAPNRSADWLVTVPHPIEAHRQPPSASLPTISTLNGIYRPIRATFPNNPTRIQRLVVRQGSGMTGLSPSLAPLSRGLRPSLPLRKLLQTIIRTTGSLDFQAGRFLIRSLLLRESFALIAAQQGHNRPLVTTGTHTTRPNGLSTTTRCDTSSATRDSFLGRPRAGDQHPPTTLRGKGRCNVKCPGRHALNLMASGTTCFQRLDGSRDSTIHTKYRISLHSSSMRKPRYPLPRVI
ncbi:hypothetical protein LOK49_LG12G03005 [Camellia lanceoleosa]|uniref:Uncharacterized protein n=1 Tax=Camellia lanceoleosa TaxID=1840588 RepID=A0ACC0FSR0_9ERIC|nr:hypothetical protein LOK49_LG12G03005 [Camellia lanceoleosa]